MASKRLAISSITAAAALALVVGGCGKKDKGADKSDYKAFPEDTDYLLGVNGDEARDFVGKYARTLPDPLGSIVSGLKSCGIDVIRGTDSAVIGGNAKTQVGVAVVKGFEQTDFVQCGEVAKEFVIENEDKTTSVSMKGVTMNMAWIDDGTFVGGPFWKDNELIALAEGKGGPDSDELMKLLGKVDRDQAIWFALAPNDPEILPPLPVGGRVSAAYGSIDLSDGMKLKVGAVLDSEESAKGLASMAEQVKPQLEADVGEELGVYLDKIEVGSDGSTLILKLSLSEAELSKLERLIRTDPRVGELMQMLGGM